MINMEQTKEIDIDLRKIFYMMRTKVVFIILFTLLGGIIAGCFTHFFIDPTYSATVKMYVYSNTDRISSDTSITQNEITASKELVNTYIYVLESNTVLNKVADDLDLNLSASELKHMVNASLVEDTQAFQVTVNTKDKNLSAQIANSIAKVAPEEIVRVVKAGGVEIIDYATVPSSPSSPNLKKNILVGALLLFVISFLGFFIYEMFDSTITNAKDIEREFDIPVLGTVPRLDTIEKKSGSSTASSPTVKAVSPPSISVSGKPSSALLENIQALKGETKDE